jgi:ribose transport system permease protein
MFYIARGLAAWIVTGQQLTGFPESFNLLGRKLGEIFRFWGIELPPGIAAAIGQAVSVQTLWMFVVAGIAGVVLAYTPLGQKIYATGGNRRAADYAGINTRRVRFTSLLFSGICAAMAGVIYVAFYRSFNPTAGQFRELDAIAAVIIGGGSIFGGYGTIIGALAGAAVITLIRSLLSLQIIVGPGQSFVMPQHWVNVIVGFILIIAVLADIWIRQQGIFQSIAKRLLPAARKEAPNG